MLAIEAPLLPSVLDPSDSAQNTFHRSRLQSQAED